MRILYVRWANVCDTTLAEGHDAIWSVITWSNIFGCRVIDIGATQPTSSTLPNSKYILRPMIVQSTMLDASKRKHDLNGID